jgi:hypothetical protein
VLNISPALIAVIEILGGMTVILFGRRLFNLSVAFIGFAFGLVLAGLLWRQNNDGAALLIALAFGLAGTAFAIKLRDFVLSIVGFLGGGMLALELVYIIRQQLSIINLDWPDLIIFLVGGALGWLAIEFIYDWALVALTAFLGADMLVNAIDRAMPLAAPVAVLLLTTLGVIGVSVQSQPLRAKVGASKHPSRNIFQRFSGAGNAA